MRGPEGERPVVPGRADRLVGGLDLLRDRAGGDEGHRAVAPGVIPDLVPVVDDPLHGRSVVHDLPPVHVERGGHPTIGEHVEDSIGIRIGGAVVERECHESFIGLHPADQLARDLPRPGLDDPFEAVAKGKQERDHDDDDDGEPPASSSSSRCRNGWIRVMRHSLN